MGGTAWLGGTAWCAGWVGPRGGPHGPKLSPSGVDIISMTVPSGCTRPMTSYMVCVRRIDCCKQKPEVGGLNDEGGDGVGRWEHVLE